MLEGIGEKTGLQRQTKMKLVDTNGTKNVLAAGSNQRDESSRNGCAHISRYLVPSKSGFSPLYRKRLVNFIGSVLTQVFSVDDPKFSLNLKPTVPQLV
jgi:hypothetical protein